MKLYQLTNLKTGKKIARKMSEAEMATLRNTKQPGSERKMVELYSVEEFDVPVRTGVTFKPPTLPALTKKETKGPAAAGQTSHGSKAD